MTTLTLIRTVTLIHLLAVISPGPDFVVAVKNSLTYGRKTGIWTAIGIGLGIGVHLIYCMAGLALLISQSILLFSIIKFIGAGYLIYIGVSSILAKSSKIEVVADEMKPAMSPMQAVWNGFLTNVLNPKATMFFLSLFTLVISPDTSISLMILLGVIMIVNTMLRFSLVAFFFTNKKVVSRYSRFQGVFNKVFGGILVALGVKVALATK